MRLALLLLLAGCLAAPEPPRRGAADAPRPAYTEADLARAVHGRVNAVRRQARLEPLAWDGDLARVARVYSADMARRGFFGHVDPDGRDPTARAARAGYTCRRPDGPNRFREGVGENLFRTSTFRRITETTTVRGTTRRTDWYALGDLAETVVQGWMDSPGHRRNLLDGGYRSEGVGVRIDGQDVFVVEALC